MAARMTHEATKDLLGAYALDAVMPDERAEIEAHLETCAECRTEVEQHRETAALLASVTGPPPARIWEGIAAGLDGPVSLEERRERRSWSGPARWVAGAAAAVVVAVVAFLGANVLDQGKRLDRLASVQDRQRTLEGATAALVDPDRRVVELRSPDGDESLLAVVLPDGSGYIVRDNLTPLPDSRTYQLWALVGEREVSAAVLGADPGVTAFRAPASAHTLAVTEERAGGAETPQSAPLVVGTVRTQ